MKRAATAAQRLPGRKRERKELFHIRQPARLNPLVVEINVKKLDCSQADALHCGVYYARLDKGCERVTRVKGSSNPATYCFTYRRPTYLLSGAVASPLADVISTPGREGEIHLQFFIVSLSQFCVIIIIIIMLCSSREQVIDGSAKLVSEEGGFPLVSDLAETAL